MNENRWSKAEFAEYRRTRDRALRDRIVGAHVGLAYSIARRFEGRGEERDDLRQVALIALVHAVERFDPARGLAFTTFAAPTITGTLKRHLRDRSWLVRPPRSVNERSLETAAVSERLTASLGRTATSDEIGAAGGWTRREVEEALFVATTHRLYERETLEHANVNETFGVADDVERVTDRVALAGLLDELEPRERKIVGLRYLDEKTQTEIAEHVGLSQMHVSRLLTRSLDTLRETAQERQLSRTA
jgi:RNA polymerase sigma-B factor